MSTRKALLFSFIDRYSGLVLSIASSMAIARLLSPADFGVFSVAMALLMLAATVRDMGAGQYLVQTKEITQQKIKAVWTLQLGVGVGLAVIVGLLAVPAASFYREPQLIPILWIMAASYVVNPIGSTTHALLMREMRFQHVAIMRFSAGLVAAVVSVGLAYRGAGPISLAWGNLAGTITNALAAQLFRDRSQPWGISLSGVSDAFKFGSKITGTSIITSLQNSTPDFVLGKLQGMAVAGLYSRSNGLVSMFNRLVLDAIWGVAVSALAAQARNGDSPVPLFLRALSYITVLNWVFAVNLIAFAQPITELLYGEQWDASVSLTRLLAIASAALAPIPICAAINTALGRPDNALRAAAVTAACAVPATIIGGLHSLQAVGVLMIVSAVISSAYWLKLTVSLLQLSLRELLQVLRTSLVVAMGCSLAPAIMVWSVGLAPDSKLATLCAAALLGGVSLLCCLQLFEHPLNDELSRLRKRMS